MPQIKYSGLVTDIKGKAGGSVFASNKQGSYFRNNKWGGGRKSARWDKAKNNLSILSSNWRGLTAEQKTAWNDMAINYPFYNKFKVEYTPSGYQLYMSLNGNLLAAGFPLLTVPNAPRPYPEDLVINPSTPDLPWVTVGTGATFPYIGGNANKPCIQANVPHCPNCYYCVNGQCEPIYSGQKMIDCLSGMKQIVPQVAGDECSTDQDCYDAGLGTGNDIECQNGTCVYVGDGFLDYNSYAYVLNISSQLADAGAWTEETDFQDTTVNGSFRITFGDDSLNILATTSQDVMLMSSYGKGGNGLNIRARQIEQGYVRFFFTIGVRGVDNDSTYGMFVWYQDIDIKEIMGNSTIQFKLNPGKTQGNHIAINNSGWLPAQFGYYDSIPQSDSQYWGDFDNTNNNPFGTWAMTTEMWGLVYGAGRFNNMTDCVYADIRWWSNPYSDYTLPLIGYLEGSEVIVITANGDAKPKCNYVSCNPDLQGICKPETTCICKHNVCGTWGQKETFFPNKAPNGDPSIIMYPAVPVMNVADPENDDWTYSFGGTWMNLDGGYFGYTKATYVPQVTLDITAPALSGLGLMVYATRPKNIGSTFYPQEMIYLTTISLAANGDWNLWDFIKPIIASVPLGSEIAIGWDVVDSDTGYVRRPRTGVRFKAGAELSSSVN